MGLTRRAARLVGAFLLVMLAVIGATRAEIQNEQIGFSPNHVFDGAIENENVDVMTGNVNLSIPLGQRFQLNDWFGYQVRLYYNSRVWKHDCDYIFANSDCPGDFFGSDTYGLGFRISFARVYRDPKDFPGIFRYQTSSGGEHMFCDEDGSQRCEGASHYTFDSSTIQMFPSGDPGVRWEARPGDGTIVKFGHGSDTYGWHATRIETIAREFGTSDPQHYYDIEYGTSDNIARITDSAGREILFQGIAGGPSIRIIFPSSNGTTAEYDLNIDDPIDIIDPSDRSDHNDPPFTKRARLLRSVVLPESDILESYRFLDYDAYGSLQNWVLPTGAQLTYYYTTYKSSQGKPYHRNMYLKRLAVNRRVYQWTYTRWGDGLIRSVDDWWALQQGQLSSGSNPYKVSILDPFDNLTVYRFHTTVYNTGDCDTGGCDSTWTDGLLSAVESYAGPELDGARLVSRKSYRYTYDNDSFQFRWSDRFTANQAWFNVRLEEAELFTPGGGGLPSSTRRVVYSDWNSAGISGARMHQFAPRPRLESEYVGNRLYRTTYTAYPVVLPSDFHDFHDYVELRDAAGGFVARTDKVFDINRRRCEVRRAKDAALPAFPMNCDDPATLALQDGDSATIRTYDSVDGSLTSEVVRGINPATDSFTSNYVYENGVLKQASYAGLAVPWLSVDRTLDPDTGQVISTRDPAGYETIFDWDRLGRLTRVAPESPEVEILIEHPGLRETVVRKELSADDFVESVYHYDHLGRLDSESRRNIDGGVDERLTEYDVAGRVVREAEWAAQDVPRADRDWTTREYRLFADPDGLTAPVEGLVDPLGRISRETRPDGSTQETIYHGLARIVTVRGIAGSPGDGSPGSVPLDSTTTYLTDAFGRLIGVTSPDGGADAAYAYDELDRLIEVGLTDPASPSLTQKRRFRYDGIGRLSSESHPESGTTEYTLYDARGKLLEFSDARGNRFVDEYDAAGRILTKQLYAGTDKRKLLENVYDVGQQSGPAQGRLTTQFSYRIDHNGFSRLVSTRRTAYGNGLNWPCVEELNSDIEAFDGLNGRVSWTSMEIEPWDTALKTAHCYDAAGVDYLTDYPQTSSSGRTRTRLSHVYVNGWLWGVQDLERDLEYLGDAVYDSHGSVLQFRRGNGVTNTIQRDLMGRPVRFDVAAPAVPYRADLNTLFGCSGDDPAQYCGAPWGSAANAVWTTGDYSYDLGGNIESIGANTYRYDGLNRLVESTVVDLQFPQNVYRLDYGYDGFGNQILRDEQLNGGAVNSDSFGVDPARNRLLGYVYDSEGNVAWDGQRTYEFDERNRLTELWLPDGKRSALYDYDGLGRRVRSVAGGIETFYYRDETGQLLSEFRRALGSSDPPEWSRDYVHGLGQILAVVSSEVPSPMGKPRVTGTTASTISIEWDLSPDDDIIQYQIWRTSDSPFELPTTYFVDASTTSQVDDISDSVGQEFTYTIKARNAAFINSTESPPLVVRPFDGVAAPRPPIVEAFGLDGRVRVEWAEIGTDDLQGYLVDRKWDIPSTPEDWHTITATAIPRAEYMDHDVVNGRDYRYRVRTVDTAGNQSINTQQSNLAQPRDWTAPTRPIDLRVAPGRTAGTIIVKWSPVLDFDVDGYMLYRSTTPGVLGSPVCASAPTGNPPICSTTDASTTEYLDVGLADGTEYFYSVFAFDLSGNLSATSETAAARSRTSLLPAPSGVVAEFFFDEGFDPVDIPSLPHPYNNCSVISENDDFKGIRVEWQDAADPQVGTYRIYREDTSEQADGVTTVFQLVGVVNPAVTPPDGNGLFEYRDDTLRGYRYKYYVVSVSIDGIQESAASVESEATDDFESTVKVRNLRAIDGRVAFETPNARSRAVRISWSKVTEQRLVGYHVYRRCEWIGGDWFGDSMQVPQCVHSWSRLTDHPVQSTNTFVDRPGGMSGIYLYAIRPVGPDYQEGEIFKLLEVDLSHGLLSADGDLTFIIDGVPAQCRENVQTNDLETKDYLPAFNMIEQSRINASARGTVAADGPPGAPTGVTYEWRSHGVFMSTFFVTLRWDANPESDLAGYHVETAGAPDGPWHRLTRSPVAWWETLFDLKGMRYDECRHYRVIAVDETGLQSAPAAPTFVYNTIVGGVTVPYGPPTGGVCAAATTPDAPTGFRVSTSTQPQQFQSECTNRLQWDRVPGADRYNIYRYSFYSGGYTPQTYHYVDSFYRTQIKPDVECAANHCVYVESGDSNSSDPDPNRNCPWSNHSCSVRTQEAYYVTAVGALGGESPPTPILHWDCAVDPEDNFDGGFEIEREVDGGAADSIVGLELAGGADSAPTGAHSRDGSPRATSGSTGARRATRAHAVRSKPARRVVRSKTRREASTIEVGPADPVGPSPGANGGSADPPWEVLDLHTDHLGSVRLLTDDAGNVVRAHDYFPFGKEITPVADPYSSKLFTGHERDSETGLDYMMARYYGISLPRFLSVDPGNDTALEVPDSWNKYTYVRNNPILYTDPGGTCVWDVCIGEVIALGALATAATIYLGSPNPGNPNQTNAEVLANSLVEGAKLALETGKQLAENLVSESRKAGEGAKSAEEYDRHVADVAAAEERIRDLESRLEKAKGPKKRRPIEEQIKKEKGKLKRHKKEIEQKWPKGRPKGQNEDIYNPDGGGIDSCGYLCSG